MRTRSFRPLAVFALALVALMLLPKSVRAEDVAAVADAGDPTSDVGGAFPVNFVWTIVAAILVFWMQAGFALVEAGLTRAKNTVNIMMKNLMDFAVV